MTTLSPLEALELAIDTITRMAKGARLSIAEYSEKLDQLTRAREAAAEQAMKDEQNRVAVRAFNLRRRSA